MPLAIFRRSMVGRPMTRSMLSRRQASSFPISVEATPNEVRNGALGPRSLETAIRHLHHDGLVVITNVIPDHHLDHLNTRMVSDARILQARGKDGPFNYNQGNLQQDAPPVKQYFDPSIFTNPIASQITSTFLGPRPKWTFCSGNTAMPPLSLDSWGERQPVHSDADFAHPSHPFALVVNVPLVTMTPENGSTEVWLGTHTDSGLHVQEGLHGERASGRIKHDFLEQQRAIRPPSQPMVPKGSIIVRDLRLWHAGMPNMSDQVRVMLAVIHFAPWYRNGMKLELAEDLKDLVDEAEKTLEVPVDYVSEEKALHAYMNRPFGNAYDFSQAE